MVAALVVLLGLLACLGRRDPGVTGRRVAGLLVLIAVIEPLASLYGHRRSCDETITLFSAAWFRGAAGGWGVTQLRLLVAAALVFAASRATRSVTADEPDESTGRDGVASAGGGPGRLFDRCHGLRRRGGGRLLIRHRPRGSRGIRASGVGRRVRVPGRCEARRTGHPGRAVPLLLGAARSVGADAGQAAAGRSGSSPRGRANGWVRAGPRFARWSSPSSPSFPTSGRGVSSRVGCGHSSIPKAGFFMIAGWAPR